MSIIDLRSRRFWVLFLGVSLVAAVMAFKLMFNYVPSLNVDIQFSRNDAVAAAAQFQKTYFPNLHTNRVAARFGSDYDLQNYVELEGGGIKAYKSIINNVDAATHYWEVRNFSEGQEKELNVLLSPKCDFIAFTFNLPDKEKGAALEEAAARAIAEKSAQAILGKRFAAYRSFDSKSERQTSGRIDYTFTYEHQSLKMGEAHFRISVLVAGDQFIGLQQSTNIPDAFVQRFKKMRAQNTLIKQIADYLMVGLFGLCGLIGGGIWLHRQHQLHWKRGLLPAGFVTLGLVAAALSNLPMAWFNYSTTELANHFLLHGIAGLIPKLIGFTLVFATIYAVAEGLSRMAFTDHPRLFDVVRRPMAASPEIMGRALGAYAWVGFFLLYAIGFQLLSSTLLGWWSPVGSVVNPNILASWRPALGPIFSALQAGTWEECLFRAIPLALASMIGTRFGIRRPLLIFTLVLQALIFGAAHADYAQMPGYSRLVELFIPALVFGLVYLRFGLLVGMLTHFMYDLVLMSLPIFVAADASLLIDKALVILAGTAPLLYLLWARYRAGAALALDKEWRNGIPVQHDSASTDATEIGTLPQMPLAKPLTLSAKILLPVALAGLTLVAIAWLKPPAIVWPLQQVGQAQAKVLAAEELARHGVKLSGEWHMAAVQFYDDMSQQKFVWEKSNPATFQKLIGRYLYAPLWEVHWRKLDGPVEARSEDWDVYLRSDGSLDEITHSLPEAAAGAKLTRDQAAAKAMAWIVEHKWGDVSTLEEKSVEQTVQPNRIDWTVRYFDKAAFSADNGNAYIQIDLSGDEITGFARGIDVPEEWNRSEAATESKKTPFNIVMGGAMLALLGMALIPFFRKHSGRKLNFAVAAPWVGLTVLSSLGLSLLSMEQVLRGFQPTMGWNLQIGLALCTMLLSAGSKGLIAFFLAQVYHAERPLANARISFDLFAGACFAIGLVGLMALGSMASKHNPTPFIYMAQQGSYIPWLATILNGLDAFFGAKGVDAFLWTMCAVILVIGSARFLQNKIKATIYVALLFIAAISNSLVEVESATALVKAATLIVGLFLSIELVRRQQMGVVIAMNGFAIALAQAYVAHAAYPGAATHAAISGVCCALMTVALLRHWYRRGTV